MAFVSIEKGEIGSIDVYNTNSSDGIISSIAITQLIKSDESGVTVKDTFGNTIVVTGFPVIIKYNEDSIRWKSDAESKSATGQKIVADAMKKFVDINEQFCGEVAELDKRVRSKSSED